MEFLLKSHLVQIGWMDNDIEGSRKWKEQLEYEKEKSFYLELQNLSRCDFEMESEFHLYLV
jgi:hypothetical protein